MRGYQKRIKKMLAVLLVISVVMSAIRPQLKNLVFAEEATEAVSENGTIDDGTRVDVASEITTDESNAEVDMTDEAATEETETSDAVSDKAVVEAEDTAANEEITDTESTINQEEQTEDYKVDTANDMQTEDLDLSETEAADEELDNEAYEAVELTVRVPESGCDITINAPEGSLPYPTDELSVSARELMPGTMEYVLYLQAAATVLEQESANDISFARFFDIEILKDGEKVEPLAPVEVKIEYEDAPDIAENEELSIVHFADEGIEVIQDIELNEDATEIVYEQGSFSVTATVVSVPDVPLPQEVGKKYALVAECNGKVYIVQGDGTLTEVESFVKNGEDITTVSTNNPMLWTYILEDGNTYLRYAAEGYDFDWTQQATHFAMGYVDPTNEAGVSTEQVDYVEAGQTNFDDTKAHCNIILNNDKQIYHNGITDSYIAVDEENSKLIGNLSMTSDSAKINDTKFYLANIDNGIADIGKDDLAKNHMVNHIDISVSDDVSVTLSLAYGTYYNAAGEEILTIDKNSPANMRKTTITKEINVKQKYLRTAEIETTCNGEPIDDAFCITGYSSNAPTGYSGTQVRIEGRFKVADLPVATDANSPEAMAARLIPENQIRYKITAVQPDEEFTYTHPTTGETLYDSNGNPITVKGDVVISAQFGYWDYNEGRAGGNECPIIQPEYDENFRKWRAGAIERLGNSGMDFRLSGTSDVIIDPVALEITKSIEDTDGNIIKPSEDINDLVFDVYQNSGASSDSVKDLNVGKYTTDMDYTGYINSHSVSLNISKDAGTGLVNDYDVAQGMVYIAEDKDSIPEKIVDSDGQTWLYKNTYIETEYVWRQTGDEGKVHVSKTYDKSDSEYASIPEVLGTYDDEFNGFLEFHVHNVYEKVEAPKKQEIAPYKGTGTLGGVNVGDEITYEISFKNYKNEKANVVIVDKLDANVDFVSASNNGVYDKSTHTVTWTIKDVPAGNDGKVTLKVKVLEGALASKKGPGKVVNGGDTSTVKIGNDAEFTLDIVENPVEEPKTTITREPNTSVKTKDATNMVLIVVMMIVSITGIFLLRKREKE